MRDALPALVRELINSVMAPRGNPPPTASSRKNKLVIKRVGVVSEG
jgi:hypothetical protein